MQAVMRSYTQQRLARNEFTALMFWRDRALMGRRGSSVACRGRRRVQAALRTTQGFVVVAGRANQLPADMQVTVAGES